MERAISKQTLTRVSHPHSSSVTATSTTITTSVTTSPRDAPQTSVPSNKCSNKSSGRSSTNRIAAATASKTEEERWKSRTPAAAPRATAPTTASAAAALQNVGGTHGIGHQTRRIRHHISSQKNYTNKDRNKGYDDNNDYCGDDADDRQTKLAAAGSYVVETNSFPQYALGNGFATNYCDTEKSVVNGEPSYIATRPAAAAVPPAVMTHEEDQLQLVHRFKELRRQQIQQQEILMQQQKQQLLLLRQEMEQRQKIMANIHTDGAPAGLIRYHVNAETPPRIQLHNPAPPSAPCLSSKGDFISSSEDESLPDTEQGLDGFHALPEDGGSDKGLTGHLSQMNSPRRGNGNYTDQNNAIHRGEETSPLCDGNSECYDEARCLKDTPALATTSNDLERLRPVNVNSGNLEDERPITSKIGRVKTFQQLLEEELQKENSTPTLLLANPKRNFLRRGEGIARFHPPANKKSIQRHTERSSSRSKSVSVPQRAVPRMLKKQSVPKRPTSQPVLLRNKLKETKVDLEITQCKPPIYPPPVNRRRSKSAAAKPMSSSSLSSQYSNTLSQKPQSTTTTTTMVIMTSLASSSHGSISSSQTTRSVPSVSVPFSHSSKTQVPTTSANIIQDGGSGNGESNEINKNAQFFEDTGAAAIPANAEDVERILKAIYEGQPLPQDSEEVEEAAGKGSTMLNETLSNSVEVETKDLAEFEFMEQLADDMSFCSDSSVVVKFMDKRLPCSVSKLKDVHASPSSLPASWGSRNSVPCHRSSIFNSAISSDREDTLVNGVTDSSSDTSETLFSSSERCSEVDVADIGTDGVEGDDGGCGDKMFWTEEEVTNDGYVKKNDSNRQIDYNDGDTQYNDVDTQINEVVEYQESDGEDRCVDLGQSAEATMMGFGAMSKTGTVQNKIDTLFLDSSPKSRRDQDRGQRSPQQREVVGTAGETRSAMVSATSEPGAAAVCRQHWHRIHANGNRDSYANPGSQIAGHSEVKVVPLSARGITRKIAVKEGGSWQPVRGGYINKSVGTEVEQECVVGTNATTSVTFGARGGGSERFGSGVENEQDEDEEGGGSARSSNFCSSDECMTDDDAAAVGRTLGTDTVNGSNLGGRCIDIRGGFAADARGRSTASASDASPLPSDEEGSGGENADDDNRNNNDDDDSDDDCSDDDEDAWNDTCDSVKKIEESLFQKSLSQKQDPPTVVLKTNSAVGKSSSPSSPSSSVSTPPTSTLISKLFPALQLRPQDNTKDEKQSLSQATKVPIREASQSHLLREKLAQLEKEITRFQKENTHLEKLRLEREESVKKLREEIAKFDLVKKNEIQKLEEFKEQELKKIKNEKKLFEKYKKAVRSLPSKQDRQEIETLKSHLKDLQEEMKRKESRWNANNNRLRQRIQELEDETHQLKDEIHFMEKRRLEWIKEKEAMNQAKRKSIQPISQTPNLSLSTLNSSCDSQTEDEAILEHVEVIRNGMLPSSLKSDHHSGRQRQQQGLNQQQQQASDSSSNKPLRSSSEALPRRPNVTSAAPQDLTVASKLNFNRNNLLHEDEGEEDEREERKKNKKNGNRNKNKTKRISLKHPGILKGNVLEKIHHSDGKAEKVYQNGARELIFSNGTRKEMSADGKHIALHFFNGDIKQITADQTVIYFYAESETMVTTYPDGLEVLDFPTGQIEKHFPNGTQQITFPDQTVKYLHEDGSEESHCLDGTVIKVESNGIRTLHFPNGQREIHTDKFKRREYPDGTRKTIYPDGRQETKFANGHVRIKDRDGNVLLDKKL